MAGARERVQVALPAYFVAEELGRGAFGVVWGGEHRGLGRRVAIKQLSATDAGVRARFLAEAKVLASLEHPHIVPLYDYVENDEFCLLVMELLEGGTLAQRFFRPHKVDLMSACAAAMATCAGLEHAHRRGVLHRDIKPQNLLFSADDVLKVTDFGIAKVVSEQSTSLSTSTVGGIKGTPAYMSPEQIAGDELGPGVDIYATGVLLYELLSGTLPFSDQGSAVAIAIRHLNDRPVSLVEVAPDLAGPLTDVTMTALSRSPGDRFSTAQEFGVAIGEAASAMLGSGWLDDSKISLVTPGPILDSAHVPAAPGTSSLRGRTVMPPATRHEVLGDSDADTVREPPPPQPPSPPPGRGSIDTAELAGDPPRINRRAVVALAAVIVVVAGSIGLFLARRHSGALAGPTTTTTTTTSTTVVPAGPCPTAAASLPAGVCQTSLFHPSFVRQISSGWVAPDAETTDGIEFSRPAEQGQVSIVRVAKVFAAEGGDGTQPAPADLASWLESHPRLRTGPPSPVTIGGAAGTQFTAAGVAAHANTCGTAPCIDLFQLTTKPPNVAVALSDQNRISVVSFRGVTIVVVVEAPPPGFDAFAREADQLLSTVRFVSPTPTLAAVCPAGHGVLPPTTCQTSVFHPAFVRGLTAGWSAQHDEATDAIDFSRPDGLLTIFRVARVFSPDGSGRVLPAPADLLGWLQSHPRLSVGPATAAVIGGASGTQVETTVSTGEPGNCIAPESCFRLFQLDKTNFDLVVGNRNRFDVLSFQGETFVIAIEAKPEVFDTFSGEVGQLLSTVQFVHA